MKNETSTTTLLGITQQELAQLLKVSRPLITLYEAGQRDLPGHAKPLLADMLSHMQSPETAAKNALHAERQNHAVAACLASRLKENEFKSLQITKKIAAASKNLEAALKRAHLVEFFTARASNKIKDPGELPARLPGKRNKPTKKDTSIKLTEMVLEQEMLAHEKTLLESKLRKILTPEMTRDEQK
jgi:transcriptional regulator with XRE-family HTH domain